MRRIVRPPALRSTSRWLGGLAALAAGVAVVFSVTAVRQPAPAEAAAVRQQGVAQLHLPALWKNIVLSQINRPRGRTPTPAPTATATREPSPTVMATFTPLPSSTPPIAGDGEIRGTLMVGGEPGPPGLGDFGPGLLLLRCVSNDLQDCERVGRTGVHDEEGHYMFASPPPLEAGAFYVVEWRNESIDDLFGDPRWLGLWRSQPIVTFDGQETVELPPFELANIELTGPTKGAGFGSLPVRFTWDTRRPEVGEYVWALSEAACPSSARLYDRGDAWRAPSSGRRGEYTLRTYPPNTQIGIEFRYCWFVEVQTDDRGFGWSHERWALWFEFMAFRPFGMIADSLLGAPIR